MRTRATAESTMEAEKDETEADVKEESVIKKMAATESRLADKVDIDQDEEDAEGGGDRDENAAADESSGGHRTEVADAVVAQGNEEPPLIANEEPPIIACVSSLKPSNAEAARSVVKTVQIKQILGANRKLNLRLQPCDAKTLPVSSVSAEPAADDVASSGSVINLPTVFKPAQISLGAAGTEGKSSMVSVYRVFPTNELMTGTLMNTERFASTLGKGPRIAGPPQPPGISPVKRKRGRPRLYPRPEDRHSNPILPNPKRTQPESSPTKLQVSLKSEDSPPLAPSSQVKFSIADLPPEERPSFAFRRDLRKQLKHKSLDERIMWALGKKPTVKEEGAKTSRSGRVIRPTQYVTENDEYEITPPEPPRPLPPPPKKRGRPRKIRPLGELSFPTPRPAMPTTTSTPCVDPPSPPTDDDNRPTNHENTTALKTAISAIEDSLLSEDYINRNLEYWLSKKKELEQRRELKKQERGPPKSVNVVVQSSSTVEDEDVASDSGCSQEIRHMADVPDYPLRSMTLARTKEYRLKTQVDKYRPILPRPASQQERLENFRRRAVGEAKMRLIRGVDFIPVQDGDEPEVEYKKFIQSGVEERSREEALARANSKRKSQAEETEGDLELKQLIDEALRESRAAKRKRTTGEAEEGKETNVDIDADEDDAPDEPVTQLPSSNKSKRRRIKPVGMLADAGIADLHDPDATPHRLVNIAPRPATASKPVPPAADDDDEPPLITSKPTTSAMAADDDSQPPMETIDGEEDEAMKKVDPGRKRQARKTPTWPFGPSAPEEKRVFRRPSKPSTKIAPTTERRLIYSLMQNAAQLALKPNNNSEEVKVEDMDPLSYIVLESESESESEEETEDGEKKKEKPRKNYSCAAVTIKLAATTKSSLVFAPPTDVYDEATHIEYEEGMDSGVEENGVLWKFPTQYFNGAKYQEIAPPEDPYEPAAPEPKKRNTNRAPTCSMNWAAPDYGVLPPNNKCPHCNRSFNDNSRLWRHLISHSDKKPFVCSLCGKGHRLPEYLSYHFRLHHSSTEDLLPCPHCPKRALFYSQLEAHLLNKHEAPRPYQCGQCVQAFALEASLENHVRSFHDPQPHMCDFCGHTFTDEVARLYHQRSHAQERPFQCSDCNKAFRSKVLLGHHRMVEHEIERQHECPKCLKSFFFLKDMHKHMASSHTEPEPYQCTHCPAQFARKIQLTRHVEKSHRTPGPGGGAAQTNRPFRCQVCQACFVSERLLLRHQASVHSERHFPAAPPQQPPQAPPASGQESGPDGKRKMFSCRYCDLLFTARTAVTQHIESVHIDTMALRCRHCRQPCINHSDLERHILEHKERRETLQTRRPNRRQCVACGEMMPSRAALEKHLKEEHDELVQFMCPICGEFFLTNQLYYEHTCRQEAVTEIRRTRYSGQEEAAEAGRQAPGEFSSDEEAGVHAQQQQAGQAPIEGQEETVEAYPEWQRRPQWPEFREEGSQYYSHW